MMQFEAEKIASQQLRMLAAGEAGEPASVLIELDIPPQQLDFAGPAGVTGSGRIPVEVHPESPAQRAEIDQKVLAAREFLTRVLGKPPRWLNSARAFVAQVTPEQLRQITNSSLTKRIHLNRRMPLTR